MPTIAVIGAGPAGLAAALTLTQAGSSVTVFEKSRGYGGRASTRWHDLPTGERVYIDHGAQYIRDESAMAHHLLHELLPSGNLVDIARPIWTFNAQNAIAEGDRAQNSEPKWTYHDGLATFGKLLAMATNAEIRLNTRVGKIEKVAEQFALTDDQGAALGTFDQLLIAIPSGQAAELLAASPLAASVAGVIEALGGAVYRRCITVALGYARVLKERPYYALINSDRAHPISWLAFEHDKPGHVPPGNSVILAQMAGAFSLTNWEADKGQVITQVEDQVSQLLGEDLRAPYWIEYHKWRYSLPDRTVPESAVNGLIPGLWFAGDWARGGRIHLAVQSGADVAAQMLQVVRS